MPRKQKRKPSRLALLSKERIHELIKRLEKAYPDAQCALKHCNAFELLIATILSAQCTDERVNMVTPELFRKYPTPKDLAAVRQETLEQEIRPTGFYRNKAKSIIAASQKIVNEFGGKVPDSMEQLLTLPGVARKTGNVVLGTAYRKASGVVVDTHVQRISRRLDLTEETVAEKIEKDLMQLIPQEKWISFSHEMIFHGRRCCVARTPKCPVCPVEDLCYSEDKTI
ncbi:MAG: endonuclease III [Acidobacteria bacterium]|nr:endonuclease III [Acidobacteriota bacterium]